MRRRRLGWTANPPPRGKQESLQGIATEMSINGRVVADRGSVGIEIFDLPPTTSHKQVKNSDNGSKFVQI